MKHRLRIRELPIEDRMVLYDKVEAILSDGYLSLNKWKNKKIKQIRMRRGWMLGVA